MARFMKFYPADWRSEPTLRLVSRAARSLWIDMLGLMHDAGSYRLERSGRPMTERELCDILGDNPRTIRMLLGELERAGVFDRDEAEFIVSRRLKRDRIQAELAANWGRTGGNPALNSSAYEDGGLTPIPEARSQKPEKKEEEGARAGFSEEKNDAFLADVAAAVGHDPADLPRYWRGETAGHHVRSWLVSCGLTEAEVVAEAARSREKNPEPPNGPKGLDGWMRQAGAAKQAAAAAAIPLTQRPAKAAESSPEERLAFFADWIKDRARHLPQSAIGNTLRDDLLRAGLVTQADLRERGVM